MRTEVGAVLGAAILLLAAAATPVAAQPTAAPSPVSHTSRGQANVVGRWTETLRRDKPGITFYVQDLTFTADGHFTRFDNAWCNQKVCPMFKLAVVKGTYHTHGHTVRLTTSGAQPRAYTGHVSEFGDRMAFKDGSDGTVHVLHRVPDDR
ncbi:hypothetical protein ACFH04_01625 [Streptomyces noboritoensis]|uniref:Lipoprotein n=1 Tax=Streptomyces noboritoensis TaxID=67337 RepID=A0ABV6T9H9_9ACTN